MQWKEQLLLSVFLGFFFTLFEQCYQLQSQPSTDANSNLFLVERNRRQLHGKMKVTRVNDDLACMQQCSRLSENCTAVNFKKDLLNGLHDCELLTTTSNVDEDIAFEDNQGFDNFIIQVLSFF